MNVVYTCGLCNESCDKIDGHPCIVGFKQCGIDENNRFYPTYDDGTIIRWGEMPHGEAEEEEEEEEGNKENTPESIKPVNAKQAKSTLTKKLNEKDIEILILGVQQRPPLWNFSLPVSERSRETTKLLWNQVSLELGGKLSGPEAKIKFKSLRDRYRKIIQSEQRASGSAQIESKEQWKHYDLMNFLRDSCLIRTTVTNVESETAEGQEIEQGDDENMNDTQRGQENFQDDEANSTSGSSGRKSRSRRNSVKESEDALNAINRIADAICSDKESSPIILPAPPQMDDVDCMLYAAGLQLRRLNRRTRMITLMEIMNLVNEKVDQED